MLRIHCMQQWYNLSDEAMEDALYEIAAYYHAWRSPNNIHADHPITFMSIAQ
jgi:IS5 family transposase